MASHSCRREEYAVLTDYRPRKGINRTLYRCAVCGSERWVDN